MKLASCYFIVILAVFPTFGQEPRDTPGQPDISASNFLRVNPEICTAGQPSMEDLQILRKQGVRTILNLRRPEEDPEGQELERKRAEELGFRYLVIPIDGANILPSQVEAFSRVVQDEENRPILIHCRSAGRVGALWWIHRVLNDGWSCGEAEQEARKIGLSREDLVHFARAYIDASKPQACAISR